MNVSLIRVLLLTFYFQANPAAAAVKGGTHGGLPLHIAIRSANLSGDESIVKALIKAYPEAVKVADEDGSLPLHYACGFHVDKTCLPVVKLLLQAHPEGASAPGPLNFYP